MLIRNILMVLESGCSSGAWRCCYFAGSLESSRGNLPHCSPLSCRLIHSPVVCTSVSPLHDSPSPRTSLSRTTLPPVFFSVLQSLSPSLEAQHSLCLFKISKMKALLSPVSRSSSAIESSGSLTGQSVWLISRPRLSLPCSLCPPVIKGPLRGPQ